MMSTSSQEMVAPNREEALPDLDSPRTKLVYLALSMRGTATATDLQRLLGLSKLTLLPILRSLVRRDLVARTEGGYAVQ
ncbi:helix-turn-helix domain-containing protein [Natronococcus jeotgali]|uniref:Transcription regulator TrmB N-terminal domain-containing protein n=1 Tax=Natronococcus jeotgali DSM 18795 TaxID=1227498 RepID=L9X227_9EURY|nr:helix-turn-helix domain-containing protein [Natronococcus jeotgali]ELY55667.1 hypothetical protein C492_15371 [Natronococcus jeotgali DSM 18795]